MSTDVDDESFHRFWEIYPSRNGKKIGKAAAKQRWNRLTIDEKRRAWTGAKNLAASDQLPKDPERFLKATAGEFPFDDWQTPGKTGATAPASARFCTDCGCDLASGSHDYHHELWAETATA